MSLRHSRSLVIVSGLAAALIGSSLFAQGTPPTGTGSSPPAGSTPAATPPAAAPSGEGTAPRMPAGQRMRPTDGRRMSPEQTSTTAKQGVPINVQKAVPASDESLDATPIVRFEPEEMNFGEMQVDVPQTGKIKIVNISDKPVTIARAIPSCGCTTPVWPKDPIPPGQSAEMEITLKPGSRAGIPLSKTVTLQVDGHAPIKLAVKGTIPEYVKIAPEMLEAPGASGRAAAESVTLTSVDGTPFRITSMTPSIGVTDDLAEAAKTAKAEQTIRIDWAKWTESGRSFRAQFASDHPKAPTLNVMIRRPVERAQPTDPARAARTADPSARPATSGLVYAAQRGDLAQVKSMIEKGEDVNQVDTGTQRTALHWAAKSNKMEIIEVLLAAGANIKATDRTGRTPLALAAEGGSVDSIKRLIAAGSEVNARDQLGGTPILWAAGLGSPEAVQTLLEAGADPNLADGNGMTPLIWAANLGDSKNVDVLLKSGKVNLEVADMLTGDTALMRACRNGRKESVTLLLASGAKLEAKNRQGMTPFLLACQSGSLEKIKLVAGGKPDLKATDGRGWNAVDHARSRGDAERDSIIKYLTGDLGIPDNGEARAAAGAGSSAKDAHPATTPAGAAPSNGTAGKGS